MPVGLDLVRVFAAVLPAAGAIALVAGVATLVLALRRGARSRSMFAAMGGATLLLAGAALLALAYVTGALR